MTFRRSYHEGSHNSPEFYLEYINSIRDLVFLAQTPIPGFQVEPTGALIAESHRERFYGLIDSELKFRDFLAEFKTRYGDAEETAAYLGRARAVWQDDPSKIGRFEAELGVGRVLYDNDHLFTPSSVAQTVLADYCREGIDGIVDAGYLEGGASRDLVERYGRVAWTSIRESAHVLDTDGTPYGYLISMSHLGGPATSGVIVIPRQAEQ